MFTICSGNVYIQFTLTNASDENMKRTEGHLEFCAVIMSVQVTCIQCCSFTKCIYLLRLVSWRNVSHNLNLTFSVNKVSEVYRFFYCIQNL